MPQLAEAEVAAEEVTVRCTPEVLRAVDTWIAECKAARWPKTYTRPEALHHFAAMALKSLGKIG